MPALYLIRHAEAATRGALLGQSDPPLSERGARQAACLRGRLPDCPVYSSPLLRARQTVWLLGKTPIVVPEFAEISYGEWDGLSWKEIEENWPEIARKKLNEWEFTTPPGGELWEHFALRVRLGLKRVREELLTAAIVAHEAVNAIIANDLTDCEVQSFKQDHCDVIEYQL